MQRFRKADRRRQILTELKLYPHVRTSELAGRFGVSTETVRRDVEALSREGLISRAYGGAAAAPMGVQPPFGERDLAHIAERERIGKRAAELVEPGEVLMVDAGSTTTQFARHLAAVGRGLTVLTNSLPVASALGQNDSIQVILCPGDFLAREAAVYGTETIDFLRRHNINRAFIGAGGLTCDGITDVNRAASTVKRCMIRQSQLTYLLIDHSKFNIPLLSVVEPLSSIGVLVTDLAPEGPLKAALAAAGVTVQIS